MQFLHYQCFVMFRKYEYVKKKIKMVAKMTKSRKAIRSKNIPMNQRELFTPVELVRGRYKPSTLGCNDSTLLVHSEMGYPLTYEGIRQRIFWKDSGDSHQDLRNLLHAYERQAQITFGSRKPTPSLSGQQLEHLQLLINGRTDKDH